ncbi:MAG TPA: FkbM family methyltransferase [Candidatus Omnitrophota bacterium]|nr:FkbM family methyltransferase [Candidatus Omnitrophota bacterium]HPN56677.1 FkbM family methyltransferase [Candidatus Omnitrophota bacterium]
MITKILKRCLPPRTPEEKARRKFFSIKMRKGDVAIDCGANIGSVTRHLSQSGADVYAFEPNPYAFRVLAQKFSNKQNVHCIPKGVSDKNSLMKLYLHEHSNENEVYWSQGSSLLDFKGNVLKDKYVEVQIIDLCEFIESLNRRVKILKLDVEGVECGILKKMIETDIIQKIDYVFVETHDHRIPELKEETDEIRGLIQKRGLLNINLDWT